MSETRHGRFSGIGASVLLAVLAAAAVGANGDAPAGGAADKLPYKLSYAVQTGDDEWNEVTIDPSGVVTASIAHSVPGGPVRSIGRYELAAGPADPDLVAIGKQISDIGLTTARGFDAPKRDGGRYVKFDVQADGKDVKYVVDSAVPLPEALEGVAVNMTALMTRVGLKAPQRAVSFRPVFDPDSAAEGDRMRIGLDVKNDGPLKTQIRNFAGFRQGGDDGIKIDFWTPQAGAGAVPKLAWTLDLTGNEWHLADGKILRPKDPYLQLEGRGSLHVWTEIRLPKSEPGPLVGTLVYYAHNASDTEQRSADLVVGLYHADPVSLKVLPPPTK